MQLLISQSEIDNLRTFIETALEQLINKKLYESAILPKIQEYHWHL